MTKKATQVQIVNKNGTPVEVTESGEVKVSGSVTLASSPSSRTTSISRPKNTTGTVAEGARSVSFLNVGPDDCTIKTVVLGSGEGITFDAGGEDDTLDAIGWTADTSANSELLITIVT